MRTMQGKDLLLHLVQTQQRESYLPAHLSRLQGLLLGHNAWHKASTFQTLLQKECPLPPAEMSTQV